VLVTFDCAAITAAGYELITPVLVVNSDDYQIVQNLATDQVNGGSALLALTPKQQASVS